MRTNCEGYEKNMAPTKSRKWRKYFIIAGLFAVPATMAATYKKDTANEAQAQSQRNGVAYLEEKESINPKQKNTYARHALGTLLEVPNLGSEISGGYFRMPKAPQGEYVFGSNTPTWQRCGSEQLIRMAFTVATRWSKVHPGVRSQLVIGDLNAYEGHHSHKRGQDVDLTTADNSAAHISGSQARSIELGKMIMDTGTVEFIFYNDETVDTAVNDYARAKGLPGVMQPDNETHRYHFHVRTQEGLAYESDCP